MKLKEKLMNSPKSRADMHRMCTTLFSRNSAGTVSFPPKYSFSSVQSDVISSFYLRRKEILFNFLKNFSNSEMKKYHHFMLTWVEVFFLSKINNDSSKANFEGCIDKHSQIPKNSCEVFFNIVTSAFRIMLHHACKYDLK